MTTTPPREFLAIPMPQNTTPEVRRLIDDSNKALGVICQRLQDLSNAINNLLTDDLFWLGSGAGWPFGEMHQDNINTVVNIIALDTYVEIDAGFTAGELNLISFPDDHFLQITKPGRYAVFWSIAAQTASVANKEVEGAVMVNGAVVSKGQSHAEVSPGGSNRPETFSAPLILNLANGEQVSLGIENHTDATDVVIAHASLVVMQIGGA